MSSKLHRTSWMAALFIALTTALRISVAESQDLSPADAARVKAGIVIATYDELAARCVQSGGFSGEQRAEVDRWQTQQQVGRVRAHLGGVGLSASLRTQVQASAQQIIQQVAANAPPCAAAVSLTRTNDARLAAQLTALLAGSTAAVPSTNAAQPAAKAPASAAPVTTASNASRLVAEIEGFAFDNCTRMGYGGMILLVPCPVVLFRNGSALTDVEGLNQPQGMQAHRQQHPDDWTQWRRNGGRLQLRKQSGWENLAYTTLYSALPQNFRLDGRYRSSSGTGNTAMGGAQAVVAWSDYLFSPDGRVQRDGGAGATATSGGTSVTSSGTAASRRGRYRIEGLILAIDYDDGSKERRVIIADPKDQGKGTMWLDGEGYIYKK